MPENSRTDPRLYKLLSVAINPRTAQYKATADFEKVYQTANDNREVRRERFVAHFLFTVIDRIANNFVPVNPLGLVITYFREDQAF